MSIEQAYLGISSSFDTWVQGMELRTRRMEVKDSADGGSRRLIVSPPTDQGRCLPRCSRHGDPATIRLSTDVGRPLHRRRPHHAMVHPAGLHTVTDYETGD